MNDSVQVVLASASPRRHELLSGIGVTFTGIDADIDESRRDGEAPERYVERLAREKAVAGWRLHGAGIPALGADTVVVLDDEILCKPVDRNDAERMLKKLSGRRHEVLSAVAIAMGENEIVSTLNRTAVTFEALSEAWVRAYCATDEPMDKAGAYAVQGEAGRRISRIDGSFTGVMGLPLDETRDLLARAGIRCI